MSAIKIVSYALIVAANIALGVSFAGANGGLPDLTYRKRGIEIHQDGVGTVKVPTDPGKPILGIHADPKIPGANVINLADKVAREPQELPGQLADLVGKEVRETADALLADLQRKFWAKFEELKASALPYVYLAAAALACALMLPGFLGALLAIWVIRAMDRRSARKQKRQSRTTSPVEKAPADEAPVRLAA